MFGAGPLHSLSVVTPRGARSPPGALRALGDVELDLLVLLKAPVALTLDGAGVHEHVRAVVLGDEPYPLSRLNHFNGPGCYKQSPPSVAVPDLGAVRPAPGWFAGEGTARSQDHDAEPSPTV